MSEINAKFFTTDGQGEISLLNSHSGWRKTWHIIVSGNFSGKGDNDLMFYDRINGEAKFFTTDEAGNITLLSHHTGWRKTWDIIVPGNFGGGVHTDLFFYDRVNNDAKLFTTDGQGNVTLLKHHTDLADNWDIIVAGKFGGNSKTGLLCYDRAKGEGKFFNTDGQGNLALLKHHTGWRKTWDIIVPGIFGSGGGGADLLFYQKVTGEAKIFTTDGQGNLTLLKYHDDLRKTWDIIVPGIFGGEHPTDLLFYDRAAGVGNFSTTDLQGNIVTLEEHNNWRKSWFTIVAGQFGKSPYTSLLFYDNKYRLRIQAIKCADSDGGREAKITPEEVQKWIARANDVYGAAGVEFVFDPSSDWEFLKDTTINKLSKISNNDPNEAEKEQIKQAASNYAGQSKYVGKIVVFFRHGFNAGPTGDGFSSGKATYVAMPGFTATGTTAYYMDGTSKKIQGIKLFAHEVGHYLGIPHTFVRINYDGFSDPVDAVIAYLNAKNSQVPDTLDGDRKVISDTPPNVGMAIFLKQGLNPADMALQVKVKSDADGIDFTFNPDRHNVMSYFNCNDYYSITADQVRRIREWLHDDYRSHLIEGQD